MSIVEPTTLVLKYGSAAALGGGIFAAIYVIARDTSSLPYRYWALYVGYIDRRLRSMFIATRGKHVAAGQALSMAGVVAFGLVTSFPFWWVGLLLCAAGPALWIEREKKARIAAVDAKIDSFILSLANSLKATPSIGSALAYTQPLLGPPLDQEVGLALKEMRLGSTVDQALMNMSARVRSTNLDAAMSSLLIGRQVGGNLTTILESMAGTLREMARLEGVVKAKTAEGKAQLQVLAVFPIFLLLLFDMVSPGYFAPLTETTVGWVVIAVTALFWVASLLVARKVLSVQL